MQYATAEAGSVESGMRPSKWPGVNQREAAAGKKGANTPLDLANMNSNVEFETQTLAAAMPEQRKGHDDGETSWFQGLVGKRSAARGSLSIDLEMHHHQGRVLDGPKLRRLTGKRGETTLRRRRRKTCFAARWST